MVEQLLLDCKRQGISLTLGEEGVLDLHATKQPPSALIGRLSAHKAQIIEHLKQIKLNQLEQSMLSPIPVTPALVGKLSLQQQRLWLLEQMQPGNAQYNLARAMKLEGKLDVVKLQYAIDAVVARHDILHTDYVLSPEGARQQVAGNVSSCMEIVELQSLNEKQQRAEILRVMNAQSCAAFDLTTSPKLRCKLLLLAPDIAYFCIVFHHIAVDGWSVSLLCEEISQNYARLLEDTYQPLLKPTLRYLDYAAWQRAKVEQSGFSLLTQSYQTYLEGAVFNTTFALDFPRPDDIGSNGKVYREVIPEVVDAKISAFAKQQQCTRFSLLYAVFNIVLAKYSNQLDIVIGCPVANREHEQVQSLIGFVANTLVLRSQIDPEQRFCDYLNNCIHSSNKAFEMAHMPFEGILEALNVERLHNQLPLFNVMLAVHNMKPLLPRLKGVKITPEEGMPRVPKFDLVLDIYESDGELALEWDYNFDLYTSEAVARFSQSYVHVLQLLLTNPELTFSQISLLEPVKVAQWQAKWSGEKAQVPQPLHLQTQLQHWAVTTPDKVAVSDGCTSLTYSELETRVDHYCHNLIRLVGSQPQRVGVYCGRSINMLCTLLAILRSGHTYVPLDPSYPEKRIQYMADLAELACVICDFDGVENVRRFQKNTITFNDLNAECEVTSSRQSVSPKDTAYMIFTSGSTGKPKGVVISYQAMMNFLAAMANEPGIQQTDCVLAVTSITFDIHVLELFLPILAGATLHIAATEQSKDPYALAQYIDSSAISYMQATPATWSMLKAISWQPPTPFTALCGGEALPRGLKSYFAQYKTDLWNMYGPTETTVWSSVNKVDYSAPTHLGMPIANTQFYVLDPYLQLVPPGVTGELAIAGQGLACGYWQRSEQTEQQFRTVCIINGTKTRVYLTGDLVKVSHDNQLIYQGRKDHQVKLNGHRIELTEIEFVLENHAAVQQAVVLLDKKQNTLHAFVQANTMSERLKSQLFNSVQQAVPSFMVPQSMTLLAELPKTLNKKIDKQALTELISTENHIELEHDLGLYAERLVLLWQESLALTDIDPNASFFSQGGNSLKLVELIATVNQCFSSTLNVTALLKSPTLVAMDNLLKSTQNRNVELCSLVKPLEESRYWRHDPIEVKSLANRVNLFSRKGSNYLWMVNQCLVLDNNDGAISFSLIKKLLSILFVHHRALRTYVNPHSLKEQIMSVGALLDKPIFYDLSSQVDTQTITSISQVLDQVRLDEGLVRVFYIQKEQQVMLVLSLHHLVFDGYSMSVLARNFSSLLKAELTRTPEVELPQDPYLSFIDYHQKYADGEYLTEDGYDIAREVEYWEQVNFSAIERLFDVQTLLASNLEDNMDSITVNIPDYVTEHILQLTAQASLLASDFHAGALATAIHHVFKLNNIALELSNFNRANSIAPVNSEALFGYVVAPVPVVVEYPAICQASCCAKAISDILQTMPHSGCGFNSALRMHSEKRNIASLTADFFPEFNFNYQGDLNTERLDSRVIDSANSIFDNVIQNLPFVHCDSDMTSPQSLYISTSTVGSHQQIFIRYSKKLFAKTKIKQLADNYIHQLKGL